MIEIKHKFTGEVIHVVEAETLAAANLAGASLEVADLTGADLSGANMKGAALSVADLIGARLADADLSAANLIGVHRRQPFRHPLQQPASHFGVFDFSYLLPQGDGQIGKIRTGPSPSCGC